jgi:TATA-box binding protein (TBP) (component of TFIID and TFIIIB)
MQPIETLASWRIFPEKNTDAPPPNEFIVFPPNCITVFNVVAQVHFNKTFDGDLLIKKYPFCRRNSKNRSAVIIFFDAPESAASVYGSTGMMMITGSNSARKSRYTADIYLHFIRQAGVSDIRITDFRVTNITTTTMFEGSFDASKYKRTIYPALNYLPSGFAGARKNLKRTGALLTLFPETATTLGARNITDICSDMYEELELLRSCMVPFGSEEEEKLKTRISKKSKCLVLNKEENKEEEEEDAHNNSLL